MPLYFWTNVCYEILVYRQGKESVQKQLQQYEKYYESHSQDEKKMQNLETTYANQYGILIARLNKEADIKILPSGLLYQGY